MNTVSVADRVKIGTGWGSLRWVVTDWEADGLADVAMIDADGKMWLYPNEGGKLSSTHRKPIGTGWGGYTHGAGNADDSPHADLFGIKKSDGKLYYYPDGGGKTQIGNGGWSSYRLFPADFTGDGRADVMAIDGEGTLWVYPGRDDGRFGARYEIGVNWRITAIG